MQVSFIIPLYNGLAYSRECLRTLQATLPSWLEAEIILVDDMSTDGTRDWLASLAPPCRVVLNKENLGFAATCNRGAAQACGESLFFLNNDLVFLPGWFEPMAALLRARDAGLVGNLQINAGTGALDHAGVHFDEKGKPAHDRSLPLHARLRGWREVPALTGACFAVRREVWLGLGSLDEGFRNGGEDIDLCLRALTAGLHNRVSVRSVVRHHVSASAGRKKNDEQNSRRLALRWRPLIADLAARAWARAHVRSVWESSALFDDALGRAALACALGAPPSASVRAGVQAALQRELDRWALLFDGSEVPSVPCRIDPDLSRRAPPSAPPIAGGG